MANDEHFEIFTLHVEDVTHADPQRLTHRVRCLAAGAVGQRNPIGYHVGEEADPFRHSPRALLLILAKLLQLSVGSERRPTLPTDQAHRVAEPGLPDEL